MPLNITETAVTSLVTKTSVPAADYVINPYIGCPHRCVYCYAEFMRRFTGHTEAWGDFLAVKRCAKPVDAARYAGKRIVLSTVTDPYNPAEHSFGVTRSVLEAFAGSGARVSVLTKSALVLRDVDALRRIPGADAGLSIASLDAGFCRAFEPGAPPASERIRALRVLREEGVARHVFVSPVFPGITDYRAVIDACAPWTDEFHFENLNLRGAFRGRVLALVARNYPRLAPLYRDVYGGGGAGYWEALEADIAAACAAKGVRFVSYFFHEKIKKRR